MKASWESLSAGIKLILDLKNLAPPTLSKEEIAARKADDKKKVWQLKDRRRWTVK